MSFEHDEDTTPDRPSAFHRAAEMSGANAAQRIRALEEDVRELKISNRVLFAVWALTVVVVAYAILWGTV